MRNIALMLLSGTLLFATSGAALPEAAEKNLESPDCHTGVDECVAQMRTHWNRRGTLGLAFGSPKPDNTITGGVRWTIGGVLPGGAAEEAGLAKGDVVLRWNGEVPGRPGFDELWIDSIRIGDRIELEIRRGDENDNFTLHTFTLSAREPDERTMEAWLLVWVYTHFSDEEYQEYLAKVEEKLGPL